MMTRPPLRRVLTFVVGERLVLLDLAGECPEDFPRRCRFGRDETEELVGIGGPDIRVLER